MSERAVDFFNTWTATAPRAGWDSVDRGDLQGERGSIKEGNADRLKDKVKTECNQI